MPPPVVHPTTQRLYDALPDFYRAADAHQVNPDYPLLRWLSLIGDQLGELEDLVDRVDYVTPNDGGAPGDTSDLTDPATADPAWLAWLAQLVGVTLAPALTVDEQRAAITTASSGWRAGTRDGMADAARTALTGTKYVRIIDHYGGDQWRVEVLTRTTETPDVALVLAAIVSKGAKPAGVELVAVAYVTTWAALEADRPTWADWEAAGNWQNLEETGA